MAVELDLTPETILAAYRLGVFPMARSRHGRIDWYSPDPRAILPLEPGAFRVRRSLRKRVRHGRFVITRDRAFERVIAACAEPRPYSEQTWISPAIMDVYCDLHRLGHAHSVEAWRPRDVAARHRDVEPGKPEPGATPRDPAATGAGENADEPGELVGGLYGVTIGGAYFGESMFSRETDASKVCLVHLVEHLRRRGFTLLDVQFPNPHLEQFGLIELPRRRYLRRLAEAVDRPVTW